MTENLEQLLGIAPGLTIAAFMVFLRIGGAMMFLPALGEQMIPMRIRLVATLALTAIVAPAVGNQIATHLGTGAILFAQGMGEVGAGLALGLSLRLVLMALQIAGTIAAQATSLSQLLGVAAVDPQPALGVVLLFAALALAAHLNLHVHVAVMLVQSYSVIGPGVVVGADGLARWVTEAVGQAFRFAFVLATPFLIASMLYNLALGVINRAMPQLMVAFVGAPAITLGALVILMLSSPIMLAVWLDQFGARLLDPFGTR